MLNCNGLPDGSDYTTHYSRFEESEEEKEQRLMGEEKRALKKLQQLLRLELKDLEVESQKDWRKEYAEQAKGISDAVPLEFPAQLKVPRAKQVKSDSTKSSVQASESLSREARLLLKLGRHDPVPEFSSKRRRRH